MIYELRTYRVKPGMVGELEKRIAEVLPYREKFSPLAAFWHTELGPLNQVVHVWPYESVQRRAEIRAQVAKEEPRWPPKVLDLIETMEAEIFLPAPFMQPLPNQRLGNVYEMRTYMYQPGTIPEVLKRWADVIPQRVQLSPLVACMYSEIGELNKFVHVWAYQDLEERDRIRAESLKLPKWPPGTREFLVNQASKILLSAPFSPL